MNAKKELLPLLKNIEELTNQRDNYSNKIELIDKELDKVKNKIIESLNEKFEFITGSDEAFINISKSSQDKRIQILSLIKS